MATGVEYINSDNLKLSNFSRNITDLAYPNRFLVSIPVNPVVDTIMNMDLLKFMCTKATIPEMSITGPEVNYRGTKKMLPGDPKHGSLVLGFLNANSWKVRNFFEDWMSQIKDYQGITNKENIGINFKEAKGSTILVKQIGGENAVMATYSFYHALPLEITAMELSTESSNMTETFDVTFHYSHWFRGRDSSHHAEDDGNHPLSIEQSWGGYGKQKS